MSHPTAPLFDTHAHIISDDPVRYPPSARDKDSGVAPFTVEQLIAGMESNHVSKACVVQRYHYYRNDNSYALDACAAHPERLTPVVMLDGTDPHAVDQLRRLAGEHPIGGLRFSAPTIDGSNVGWLNGPGVISLWEEAASRRLPVNVIIFETQLDAALPALRDIADKFADTPIIVDHLGTRHGATARIAELRKRADYTPYITAPNYGVGPGLRELGTSANVHFKFSGINLGCLGIDAVDAAVFVRYFVDELGAERLVCGTDIGQTVGPYSRIAGELRDATRLLSERERGLALYGNANRIYGETIPIFRPV